MFPASKRGPLGPSLMGGPSGSSPVARLPSLPPVSDYRVTFISKYVSSSFYSLLHIWQTRSAILIFWDGLSGD